MAFSFNFRQQLAGTWETARAFLIEEFDRLYANLAALVVKVDTGAIDSTRLPANVAYRDRDNTFVPQTFAASSSVRGVNTHLYFANPGGGVDAKLWRLIEYDADGSFRLESLNDVVSAIQATVIFGRDATIAFFGGQIAFPAVQHASSSANTLDDYEEGSWTPVDVSGAGLTFAGTNGKYIKVGRIVTITSLTVYPATANGIGAIIGGLPFLVQGQNPAGTMTMPFPAIANTPFFLYTRENTTQIELYQASSVQFTNAQLSGTLVYICGTYLAAA